MKLTLKELKEIAIKELVEVSTGSFFVCVENDDGGSCITMYAEVINEIEREKIKEMRLMLNDKYPGRRFILCFCEKEYIDAFFKNEK